MDINYENQREIFSKNIWIIKQLKLQFSCVRKFQSMSSE